jgi:hypothetical protein
MVVLESDVGVSAPEHGFAAVERVALNDLTRFAEESELGSRGTSGGQGRRCARLAGYFD